MILSLINSTAIARCISLGALDWKIFFMPKATPVLAQAIELFYCKPAAICLEALEKAIAALESESDAQPEAQPEAIEQFNFEEDNYSDPQSKPQPKPTPAPVEPTIKHTLEGAITYLANQTSKTVGKLDRRGFSRLDKEFGISIASQISAGKRLTHKQRHACFIVIEKYQKQLKAAGFDFAKIYEAQNRLNLVEQTTERIERLRDRHGVDVESLHFEFEQRYGKGKTRATITLDQLKDWDKALDDWESRILNRTA